MSYVRSSHRSFFLRGRESEAGRPGLFQRPPPGSPMSVNPLTKKEYETIP